MARFSAQFTQRVRDATDLVELAGEYTELRRVGADRMSGRCPLHDERTPSFTVTPSRQLFKCFGCDAGGDALSFVQLKEGLGFPAALEFLARRASIELQREDDDPAADERRKRRARQLDLLERAAAFYAAHLRSPRSAQAALAAEYLATRGLNGPIGERFALGFAPPAGSALLIAGQAAGFAPREIVDAGLTGRPRAGGAVLDRFRGRLMFPVCDAQGRVVGFGARKLDGVRGPKYVNSPASPIYRKRELLYAAHHARAAAAKAGVVIVVEGYTDALAMHQAGILNAVALMGTAVTDKQVATLKRLAPTVVLMLDGDDAGARRSCVPQRSPAHRACDCSSPRCPPAATPLICSAAKALKPSARSSPARTRSSASTSSSTSIARTSAAPKAKTSSSENCAPSSQRCLPAPFAKNSWRASPPHCSCSPYSSGRG